ncbi:MAG: arabinose isomerase [Bacillota bacterium]|nr:MAG: arabinose isomerase [Bacillota bacterium]
MKAKIGLYSCGNKPYWAQFDGLKDRLVGYGKFIEGKIAAEHGAEVFNFGLVDSPENGRAAGEYFNAHNVDLIFCHIATYVPSAYVLPLHAACKAKTVILNLQPSVKVNYAKTDTGEWLAHCNACAAPELCNAFERAGISCELISGLLGLEKTPAISVADECTANRPEAKRAWKEIGEWVQAARAVGEMRRAKFGFLGNFYNGMLDMYSDFTLLQSKIGIDIEILEMCDLKRSFDKVSGEDVVRKRREIENAFVIAGDSAADKRVKKPTEEQLDWSAKVASAQEKMVQEYKLDALSYYYHGSEGTEYQDIQSGFIVGHSLLTANHVPCAGEADIKTCVAMKICDLLSLGGSYCEIVTTDYDLGTIIVGHDGPFHIAIAAEKPVLRGMGVYHGKQGTGISVEAKVKTGDVTILGVAQGAGGKVKSIIAEGQSLNEEIMQIGNTQTHVRFSSLPDAFMERWFKEAPTHHFALSLGKNAALFVKIAKLFGVEHVVL